MYVSGTFLLETLIWLFGMGLRICIVGKHTQDDFQVDALRSIGSNYCPHQPESVTMHRAYSFFISFGSSSLCPISLWCDKHCGVGTSFLFISVPSYSLAYLCAYPKTGFFQLTYVFRLYLCMDQHFIFFISK